MPSPKGDDAIAAGRPLLGVSGQGRADTTGSSGFAYAPFIISYCDARHGMGIIVKLRAIVRIFLIYVTYFIYLIWFILFI